jgi:uncharacterized protein YbbC (DUF1343 family)/N-acetylglucosamine kinase-like BadF-type ATPase
VAVAGIDRLVAEPAGLAGDRIGLLVNEASLTAGHRPTVEALRDVLGRRLTVLLTPEHGLSGLEEDATAVPDGTDARTGLPVASLYGPRRRPDRGLLEDLDAVVVDLRDVGVRCYTYATTVALLLEAARETGTRVVVADRPAPLGPWLDGPALEPSRRSFLGYLDVPFVHGLTLGELARHHARALGGAPLEVVAVGGWRRGDGQGGAFVPPSPGLPSRAAVALYPALVALEGTDLSEGRGTPLPFELAGGPGVDGHALAAELNARSLAGVWARPVTFRPESGKLAGEVCGGVQLHLDDADGPLRPLQLAAELLGALHRRDRLAWTRAAAMPWAGGRGAGEPWYEPVEGLLVDALVGDDSLRAVVEGRRAFDEAAAGWAEGHARFLDDVDGVLLYGPAPVPGAVAGAGAGTAEAGGAGAGGTARGAPVAGRRTAPLAGPVGLGIDAGGSSTRWQLRGGPGVLAGGRLAPLGAHLYGTSGRVDAAGRVDELAAALEQAAAPAPAAVVAGVTGLSAGSEEALWLRRVLAGRLGLREGVVTVVDDAELAFQGAFPEGDGILVYAGTGAIALAGGAGGERLRAGGHGYVIDDDGGGFSIGRAALRAVLREADRRGAAPDGPLARRVYARIGGSDWDRVRAYVYGGGRSSVAALAPDVAAAGREGDADADGILRWAGDELARLARVLLTRCGESRPVALAGGVAHAGGALEASLREALAGTAVVRLVNEEPVEAAARVALETAQAG